MYRFDSIHHPCKVELAGRNITVREYTQEEEAHSTGLGRHKSKPRDSTCHRSSWTSAPWRAKETRRCLKKKRKTPLARQRVMDTLCVLDHKTVVALRQQLLFSHPMPLSCLRIGRTLTGMLRMTMAPMMTTRPVTS